MPKPIQKKPRSQRGISIGPEEYARIAAIRQRVPELGFDAAVRFAIRIAAEHLEKVDDETSTREMA